MAAPRDLSRQSRGPVGEEALTAANDLLDKLFAMFEPKRQSKDNLANYIGARVTDEEEAWLRSEMKRRKLTMSDLIRLALGKLRSKPAGSS